MAVVDFHGEDLYRFSAPEIHTNTYVLIRQGTALVVDPHPDAEITALLRDRHVRDITIFLTHEHTDHTWGVPVLAAKFHTVLVCHEICAKSIADKRNNRPFLISWVLAEEDRRTHGHRCADFLRSFPKFECTADVTFSQRFEYAALGHDFSFVPAPGHSPGGCCIEMAPDAVFTGDNLIPDTPVITRLPKSDDDVFRRETLPYLRGLPETTLILPGHGKPFFKKEICL